MALEPTADKQHSYTSARHKISYKKLKLLTHQLKGLPIDEAILQMQFSVKGAASWIRPNLLIARDHAVLYKNMKKERLMVCAYLLFARPTLPIRLDFCTPTLTSSRGIRQQRAVRAKTARYQSSRETRNQTSSILSIEDCSARGKDNGGASRYSVH